MKILIITATYAPSLNGVAISLVQQKEELENRGHGVLVVAPHHPNASVEKNVIRMPSLPNPFAIDYPIPLLLKKNLTHIQESFAPDVIYFHQPFYIGTLSLWMARQCNVPSVFFYHTQYKKYAQSFLPNNALFRSIPEVLDKDVKKIVNNSDAVIVETESVRNELHKQGVGHNVSVIPTGRKFKSMGTSSKKTLRVKYRIAQSVVMILTVARLSKEKNISSLVHIFKQVKNDPEVVLFIVGDGPEREKLEYQCKKNNIQNIVFVGKVPFSDINDYYQMADIFAFPSVTDTQAIVLLEAMSFRLPLIGFSAPGPVDFIRPHENGYLANTEEDFLIGMKQLISNPKLRKNMGVHSYRMSKMYSFKNTIDKTEKLLQDVINNRT